VFNSQDWRRLNKKDEEASLDALYDQMMTRGAGWRSSRLGLRVRERKGNGRTFLDITRRNISLLETGLDVSKSMIGTHRAYDSPKTVFNAHDQQGTAQVKEISNGTHL